MEERGIKREMLCERPEKVERSRFWLDQNGPQQRRPIAAVPRSIFWLAGWLLAGWLSGWLGCWRLGIWLDGGWLGGWLVAGWLVAGWLVLIVRSNLRAHTKMHNDTDTFTAKPHELP